MSITLIISATASVLLVMSIGFALRKYGQVPADAKKFVSNLITRITLPCLLATTFLRFDKSELGNLLHVSLLPFCSIIATFIIAWGTARIFRVNKAHLGLFCACSATSNTMYIGLPFSLAVFGEQSLPSVLIYYFANTIFFWTVGNYVVSGDPSSEKRPAPTIGDYLRRFFAPPMLGLFCGLAILVLQAPVPEFIIRAARTLGTLTSPLGMLFIGFTLAEVNLKTMPISRDVVLAVICRLLVSPMLMICLLPLFTVSALTANVFIIQSALPALMMAPVLAAYYKTDAQFASLDVALTTVISAVSMPTLLLVFGYAG